MDRKLPSIPNSTAQIPKPIGDVLNALREVIEIRFLGKRHRDSAVTVNDLIKLGLMSESDITKLENQQ